MIFVDVFTEYGMTEEIVSIRANEERLESMADNKLKMIANNKFLHAELYDPRSLTPPTPSFEYSRYIYIFFIKMYFFFLERLEYLSPFCLNCL